MVLSNCGRYNKTHVCFKDLTISYFIDKTNTIWCCYISLNKMSLYNITHMNSFFFSAIIHSDSVLHLINHISKLQSNNTIKLFFLGIFNELSSE